ncbi:MAG: hypothetical protein COS87_02975 [Chloroflexi bacterium CG07_land_8_20_14_0_80_45_17]|nr:MAG: hypothetical protein COS87_02975 [Chloroflexi bacterium CG07_land_8_20_14_0_80_45_17]
MGYNEKVLDKIAIMEQRAKERKALWHTISDSFGKEGAEGIANELAVEMDEFREKFDVLLAKLNDML